jgi:hypothetical protein
MTREMLRSVLEIQPFRPITVHLSSGSSYQVTRRESIWPSPQGDVVTIVTGGDGFAMISLDHVTSLTVGAPESSEG